MRTPLVALVSVALVAAVALGGCRRKPLAPGSGSQASPANGGPVAPGSGSGSGDIHIELVPPPVDMSTPENTWRAARRYAKSKKLSRLFQLGLEPDLRRVAWVLHQQIGFGIYYLRRTDIPRAEVLYEEYAELAREHDVDYARRYGDRIDLLYGRAQINVLLADMLRFSRLLPVAQRGGKSLYDGALMGTDQDLTDVRITGDRATARAGKVTIRFRKMFDRWFLLFGPEDGDPNWVTKDPGSGSGSGR